MKSARITLKIVVSFAFNYLTSAIYIVQIQHSRQVEHSNTKGDIGRFTSSYHHRQIEKGDTTLEQGVPLASIGELALYRVHKLTGRESEELVVNRVRSDRRVENMFKAKKPTIYEA